MLLPDGRSENVPAGTYEWTVKDRSEKIEYVKSAGYVKNPESD